MSEVNALKTLRETTLAYLSQSDYERILKAVELGGIQSLTGTAEMVVKSAVRKHGSHDQSRHNPKKGGGGAGGGNGGGGEQIPEGTDSDALRENLSALSGEQKHLRDIASGKAKGNRGGQVTGKDEYVAKPAQQTKAAANNLRDADTKASEGDLEGAMESIGEAQTNIQLAKDGFEDQNYHDLVGSLDIIDKNISKVSSAMKRNVDVYQQGEGDPMENPFGDD